MFKDSPVSHDAAAHADVETIYGIDYAQWGRGVDFLREFSMPNSSTFSMAPIRKFISRYQALSRVSVDPFAGNNAHATYANDLNPDAPTQYHMDADDFCSKLFLDGVVADLAFFDPPYSPRQISECYRGIGRDATMRDTQNAALYKRVRDVLDKLIAPGGVVLSFGWNSAGMGRKRGYAVEKVLLVNHGGAHNDTICIAERKNRRAHDPL